MVQDFNYDVFLSHNTEDKPRVRWLAKCLRDAGLRVWFDEWVIQPGDDIYLTVEHGLETTHTVVLCISSAALNSNWVGLERSTALFRSGPGRTKAGGNLATKPQLAFELLDVKASCGYREGGGH